jgi:NADH dehydrogenase (ubiquinone) flavoprotein 2
LWILLLPLHLFSNNGLAGSSPHPLLFIYFFYLFLLFFASPQHVDTPDNNATTPFDFTKENYDRVFSILAKYPDQYKRAAIIPLLDLAQRQHGGFLPIAAMQKVASITDCPPARVYEVASFYTMFNRTKVGTYFIQLCGTTPCMICGSEDIKNAIYEELGIHVGETTKDGLFTLLEVECLGACANAPMVQLNDDYYECLTPNTIRQLIHACRSGAPPSMGVWGSLPMNGQVSCEGPHGKTSLLTPATAPVVDVNRFANGKVDPATVKKHMAY